MKDNIYSRGILGKNEVLCMKEQQKSKNWIVHLYEYTDGSRGKLFASII